MNIQEAWAYGRKSLAESTPTPELDSRLLLASVLSVEHSYLLAHGEENLTPTQEQELLSLYRRARKREPIPYLTGTAPFFGHDFRVSPKVLIPRPESEQLVELALAWAEDRGELDVVDVGTGSGCIAITLALQLPIAKVWATDISYDALQLAHSNARRYVPQRIEFIQGNLLDPLTSPVDLIVANLPYIADDEWTLVDDWVKLYEPMVALRGGADGMELIGELLDQATHFLRRSGAIFLEIGWQQGQVAQQLARKYFPSADIKLTADYAGHDRIITVYNG
ncbi:MAG: peptide chain release factor N(5)-glutamine methyltransferase [Candidatus Promineifilaceae bacterium]|nr:peptide chain release factor N(5)-glutamine methyltransferase [Candidatus Promineifilaceae bacterium]